MNEKTEPDLAEIERAIMNERAILNGPKMPAARSFAPPAGRGIHELIEELESTLHLAQSHLEVIKERMAQFDRLQTGFYNGTKP